MNHKVGDKVVVKSKAWYNENKDESGDVQMKFDYFVDSMAELCGKTVTISEIIDGRYRIKEMCFGWYDDMFEDIKTLEIHIPDGKTPKMTETTNSCVIEWVDKKKTFEDYVNEYSKLFDQDLGVYLNGDAVFIWRHEFKFGLLKFIADDLNESELDWENFGQTKCELYYDHEDGDVRIANWSHGQSTASIFTEGAAVKAMGLIPVEFLKF
jgi:hypothetical protein